eukprot:7173391-Pyramimonas_sp.AAC.1
MVLQPGFFSKNSLVRIIQGQALPTDARQCQEQDHSLPSTAKHDQLMQSNVNHDQPIPITSNCQCQA